jgi:hypothetical protein
VPAAQAQVRATSRVERIWSVDRERRGARWVDRDAAATQISIVYVVHDLPVRRCVPSSQQAGAPRAKPMRHEAESSPQKNLTAGKSLAGPQEFQKQQESPIT